MGLPFLCIHLNHSHIQDLAVMEYQKLCRAGQLKNNEIEQSKTALKNIIASLENLQVINPFAPLIKLPNDVAYPRKSLLLLLNFIEIITLFHQHQRTQSVDKNTGEIFIETDPKDIELAFKLLKHNLFRRADELNTSARGFYNWLQTYLIEAKTTKFTALDIRKAKNIHPRTLNRYLQELKLFSYLQVTSGNKHREGFTYKLTYFGNQTDVKNRIEKEVQSVLEAIEKQATKTTKKEEKTQELPA